MFGSGEERTAASHAPAAHRAGNTGSIAWCISERITFGMSEAGMPVVIERRKAMNGAMFVAAIFLPIIFALTVSLLKWK